MINKELVWMFIRRHLTISLVVAIGSGVLSFCLALLFPDTHLEDAAKISMSWPKIMKDLFGDPIHAFTDIYGWLNLQVFHITFWAIFGVFASFLASYIVATEVERKTIDTLLSCCVTRSEVIVSRLTALAMILTVSIIPFFLGCLLAIAILDQPLQLEVLLAACISGLFLILVWAATTLLISVCFSYQTPSLIITWGLFAFLFLFKEVFSKLVPALENFAYMSPFHYYRTGDILLRKTYLWSDWVVLLCVSIFFASLATIYFSRKDILL
jgi:ABC-type transport system involved in multi-copper enzyme maturation permease subunit